MRAGYVIVSALGIFQLLGSVLAAQTATLTGTVVRDSLGHELAGASVELPSLKLSATTNYRGEFIIQNIPAGRVGVVIRHVGFLPLVDTIVLGAGARMDREFQLVANGVVQLDTQRTTARSAPVEPFLRDFEERRKMGFGHFFVPEEVRKLDGGHSLLNYIASRLPGMSIVRLRPRGSYLASGRLKGSGPCMVALYIDGLAVFIPSVTNGDPPDMTTYASEDFSAIEYYAGGGTVPAQYNGTGSACGVLLMWRRYGR